MDIQLAYSLSEVAAASRVSRSTLYRAIDAGELRAVKRGRRTLVLAQDMKRWIENLPAVSPNEARTAA